MQAFIHKAMITYNKAYFKELENRSWVKKLSTRLSTKTP